MELGKYLTSFLRIYINTNLELDNMKGSNLTNYEKRIFVHEYTHFLQNITGAFGHLHAWNIYDRLRQHILEIQKSKSKQIDLPLDGKVADEQQAYLRIRRKMEGSYKVKNGMDDENTRIVKLALKKDADYVLLYPEHKPLHYLVLELQDKQGASMEYIFGEAAVSEAMALLMETKYFDTDPAANYPYHVCRILGKYMRTNLFENDEFLFALCDVSLLSSSPGVSFYRILLDLHQRNFKPASAEELFDYGLNFMNTDWRIFEDYKKSMEGICHVIQTLMDNAVFKETVDWVTYLFKTGYQCRIANRYFMLELYREPIVFEGLWNNVIAQFGNPELHNNKPIRAFIAPLALKKIEEKIEPILLIALHEVHETLFKRKTECGLVEFCKHATNGLIVDKRCLTMPWKRATDEKLCAYGALWAGFGINDRNVV